MSVDANDQTIDWRKFLFAASNPPRKTIEELLEIRDEYVKADIAGNGWILEEQYNQVGVGGSARLT